MLNETSLRKSADATDGKITAHVSEEIVYPPQRF